MNRPTVIGYDVAALGELVIDMLPAGPASSGRTYVAKPGGAPGNVAAGVARLGLKAAMLSKVGPGAFGDLLIETLSAAGVKTSGIVRSKSAPTTLAIVSTDTAGDRDFVLYRQGAADTTFETFELDLGIVRATRILHIGSLSLATPASAQTLRLAVSEARQVGALISTDVNFRPSLWSDRAAMLSTGREALACADIVKVSESELLELTGLPEIATAARSLWHPRLKVLAVTRGAIGAELFTSAHHVRIAGFRVSVVDTVGCGDAFTAALLAGLLGSNLARLEQTDLLRIGRMACASGAVMAGTAGAMEAMPDLPQINSLLYRPG
jgi:fructokinase